MRYIHRDTFAPYEAYLKHANPADWDAVDSVIKAQVRQHILTDLQFGISAYTERKLSNGAAGLHVDHFVKQQFISQKQTLEYSNFFVDEHAGSENYGADFKDNSKFTPIKGLQDNLSIINPSKEDPHQYYCYSSDGDIYPRPELPTNEKDKANKTKQTFNLSHPALLKERMDIVHLIRDYKQGKMSSAQIKDCFLSLPYQFSYPSLIEYFCDECFEAL